MNEQTQTGAESGCFCGGAGPRFTEKAKEFQSNLSAKHFRNAGVEILKGLRSILDAGIDRLAHDPNERGTTVNVE